MTNQVTDEQLLAALNARNEEERRQMRQPGGDISLSLDDCGRQTKGQMRAALEAAAGAAPQAPSVTGKCAEHNPVQHRDTKPPWCKACGLTANGMIPVGVRFPSYAASVQPSSTVDEGKLEALIDRIDPDQRATSAALAEGIVEWMRGGAL